MNRTDKKTILVLAGLPIVAIAFFVGIYVGEGHTPLARSKIKLTNTEEVTAKEFEPFWRAWSVLDQKFVGANATSTTAQKKVYGAIEGLAASYGDPYTVFFPPPEAKQFNEEISGNFEGVGMEIGIKEKQLVVVTPIKGSPADRAGVRSGDRIIAVDGKVVADLSVDKA